MKKVTFIMTFLITLSITAVAQIPNYSFENWSNGSNAPPDAWSGYDSNHSGFYPVTQTSDSYLGTFAVRLENRITDTDTTEGELWTTRPNNTEGFGPAFPITTRYNNLKGYYKYDPLNGDSAQISVFITKTGFAGAWGDLLAFGIKNMGIATTYTPFSVGSYESPDFFYVDPIVVPDSAYINISAYRGLIDTISDQPPLGNSVLIVDALNFDTYLVGINEQLEITTNFKLFPTANNGTFDVSFEILENEYTTIKVYDMQGREIRKLYSGNLSAGYHSFHYSMPELNNGYYLYMVATGKGYRSEKICIQK